MLQVADVTLDAVGWCVGNGQTIKFWTDAWLDNNGPLITCLLPNFDEVNSSESVADLVKDGCWDFNKIAQLLPEPIIKFLLIKSLIRMLEMTLFFGL